MHISEELLWAYLHNETDEGKKQLMVDHLKDCDACHKRVLVLENHEKFFQNIDYPLPSDRFVSLTSELVLSKTRTKKRAWATIFKIGLSISLILIVCLSIWIALHTEVKQQIPGSAVTMIFYSLPLVLLVLFTKFFEKRMVRYP